MGYPIGVGFEVAVENPLGAPFGVPIFGAIAVSDPPIFFVYFDSVSVKWGDYDQWGDYDHTKRFHPSLKVQ